MCSIKDCELESYKNGKCILHCEKEDWFNIDKNKTKDNIRVWDALQVKEFWKILIRSIEEDLKKRKGEVSSHNIFNFDEINLKNIKFPYINYRSFDFILNHKIHKVNFIDCLFYEKVNYSMFKKIENISFDTCIFQDKVLLKKKKIINRLDFKKCTFDKNMDISESQIINFISFNESVFYEEFNINYSTFEEDVLFAKCTFYKPLNLENIIVHKRISFFKLILIDKISNRETARIIKNSFEQQNNIIESNKYYSLEMEKRDDELKWKTDFFEKLVFKFHGISSNHSQDWILALFWILNITFGFFITEKSFELFGNTFISYIPILSLTILGIVNSSFSSIKRATFIVILTFLNYGIFRIISDDNSLDCVANKINPFSIMTKGEDLDFPTMIYKIIIAYLIYQLIISIRQNTRRK